MPNHQITWEDAQQMPDDGMRYEAIGGELIVTPAPNLRHQDIVLELAVQLRSILVTPGHGRLWVSPVGVEFPATSEGVQPDLVFVSNERRGIIAQRVPVRIGATTADVFGEVDLEPVFHRD